MKKRIKKEGLGGFLISKKANISYLSGFTGDDSYLLITPEKDFFITDFRYCEQAKIQTKGFQVEVAGKATYFDLITGLIEKHRLMKVGFEAKDINYAQVSRIRDRLRRAEFTPVYDFVEDLRIIKTPLEIKLIKKATQIGIAVFKKLAKIIKPGRKEKDLAAFMEYQMRLRGADSASFDIIVLSGKRSSLPHGEPSEKRVKNNEVVLVDAGTCFAGYNTDLTRVFFLGKIPGILKKIYGIVKTAQAKAIDAIKPGAKASYVDSIARDYIEKRGFGKYFGHSLGHGIGREVHEAPSISSRSKAILRPGMVFTIEPAIYIPRVGGIRIEDICVVTTKGAEVLSE